MAELDRDLAEGRIGAPEHGSATLEVQRRLLAAANSADDRTSESSRSAVLAAVLLTPVAAFLLYLAGGSPGLPEAPIKKRLAAAEAQARTGEALIEQLRARLAQLDPHSEQARNGYILLGNVEAHRGNMPAAAAAWGTALSTRFEPTLAMETAEAMTESAGHVTDEAAALFRQALDEAPPDARWRPMAERRLSERAEGG